MVASVPPQVGSVGDDGPVMGPFPAPSPHPLRCQQAGVAHQPQCSWTSAVGPAVHPIRVEEYLMFNSYRVAEVVRVGLDRFRARVAICVGEH